MPRIAAFLEDLMLDTSRNYIRRMWDRFQGLSEETQKKILDALYANEEYWYYDFFREAISITSSENLEKIISRLICRLTFSLPYNRRKVLNVLDQSTSLEELREGIYNLFRQDFDYSTDRLKCFQVARQTRLDKKRLVCGRFSRAFYIDALLLANSAYICTHSLGGECATLSRMIPCRPELEPLLPSLERLEALLRKKEMPRARLIHALYQFRKAVDNCEWTALQQSYENGRQVNPSLRKNLEKIRLFMSRCLKKISSIQGRCPVSMVFFQRISPAGSLNISTLNELRDPFFGEDEEIENLLGFGGENIYITPNMDDWLTQCDDWVEALPAYAAYEIEPQNGNYRIKTRVEREALEDMIRSHAVHWKKNIENVLTSEFLHAARVVLARHMNKKWGNPDDLLKKYDENRTVAVVAVLVEEIYYQAIDRITLLREQEHCPRLKALLQYCLNAKDFHPLLRDFFNECDPSAKNFDKARSCLEERELVGRLDHFLACLAEPLRKMPALHILTTLGPGETEYNVKNWLEESMLLANIIEAYNLDREVQDKEEQWTEAVTEAARLIISEGHLEAEVLRYGEDNAGILNFMRDYPEIGKKVARFCLLRMAEGAKLHKESIAAKEPGCIVKLMNSSQWKNTLNDKGRYLLRDNVRQKAFEQLEESISEEQFFLQYLHPVHRRLYAQRLTVTENGLLKEMINPLYRYEAEGPFKAYHLLYTPSRVDLGANEVSSVRDIPKWVGALDDEAANRGKELYDLYNIGGPVVIPSTKIAEFLKVGENFFSRGGVYYLSLAAGVNIDTLGFGDFEFFRGEWNKRGDRLVLPAGETYGGFCVPKEFTLLYASILSVLDPEARKQFLSSLGIPDSFQSRLFEQLQTILSWKNRYVSLVEWEKDAYSYLLSRYKEMQGPREKAGYLFPLTRLALILEKMGLFGSAPVYHLADWVNKKAQGLEEINRIGPFRKVRLIYDLLAEARRLRNDTAPPEKLIGVMAAPYKEGEMKDGRYIPISDVRFSAGCRKLEIYAGVHEGHILQDIDPEGREIIRRLMDDLVPPADIRLVGRCTGSDILNYVPGSGLEDITREITGILLDHGIDEELMKTNSLLYGGDLKKWIGVKERSPEEQNHLIEEVKGRIHLLVAEKRGTFHSYEEALQGADFIDLGIPDVELMDLVDNLPKMISLMRRERPHSALVFADGTSGGRRSAFAFRYPDSSFKVKELFALEPLAQYGCLGIGREQIEDWRSVMEKERAFASQWRELLRENQTEKLSVLLDQYCVWTAKHRCDQQSRENEEKARQLGIWSPFFRFNTGFFFKVTENEVHPAQIDFGAWLIMGGRYLLNGKMSRKDFILEKERYEKAREDLQEGPATSFFTSEEVDQIMDLFFRPYYTGRKKYATEVETGLAGSLKAVEEQVTRLARWEERKKEFSLLKEKNTCKNIFREVYASLDPVDSGKALQRARDMLPLPKDEINTEQKGRFQAAFLRALDALDEGEFLDLEQERGHFFDTLEMPGEEYLHLAQKIVGAADMPGVAKELVQAIPSALELLDIAFLLDKIFGVSSPQEMNSRLAEFFDLTLNNHIFDYLPYHYHRQRSAYFEKLSRQEKFQLAFTHHQWLYAHIHTLINRATPLKDYDEQYRDLYCGDALHNKRAIGIKEMDQEESFWFHYARLRDITVLYYESYGYPSLAVDVGDDVFNQDNVKLAVIYPYGNTTVPVALEQGPHLSTKKGADLFLCAFPRIASSGNTKRLIIEEGMICPSSDVLGQIRKSSTFYESMNSPFLFLGFKNPLPVEGIFFHFTHPLRMEIDSLKLPLIQPLAWEAATHLKCQLPAMLEGTGVGIPDQLNWFSSQTDALDPETARGKLRYEVSRLACRHEKLILKPEKESGGRKILIRKMNKNGTPDQEAIREMSENAWQLSLTDNVVVQEVLESRVRQLYDPEFLEEMVERFARINIPVFLNREPLTPLYSYFRIVAAESDEGLEYTHYMTVISTQGVANVGQGGLLFEYTDDIIHPRFRKELNRQLRQAAYESWNSQKKYLQKNWRYAVEEYLKLYPEFKKEITRYEKFTGSKDFIPDDIPYEMGDYMPVFLIDESGRLTSVFDRKKQQRTPLITLEGRTLSREIYDAQSREIEWDENNLPLYFQPDGKRTGLFNKEGEEIPPFIVYKIEANPGAGLWRPHNDQLPPERKGEGVSRIFDCLARRARKNRISPEEHG